MLGKRIQNLSRKFDISTWLRRFLPWRKKMSNAPVAQINQSRSARLSPEKQNELEALCNKLFQKKELIQSGRFQFIGLDKIKKRMHKRWEGMAHIVYDTVEEVIKQHTSAHDLYIRYRDDTYFIIFPMDSLEQAREKTRLIAEEIRRRLFERDEEELRTLEIRRAMQTLNTKSLVDQGFQDMMAMIDAMIPKPDRDIDFEDAPVEEMANRASGRAETVEVDTSRQRAHKKSDDEQDIILPKLAFRYLPLWDARRSALTSYVCLARDAQSSDKVGPVNAHKALFQGKSAVQNKTIDEYILKHVAEELQAIEDDGRALFMICPVQHQTMFRYDYFEDYKAGLAKIPARQRKYMMPLVMAPQGQTPSKDAYWFARSLRTYCPQVFAEIPLQQNLNFRQIHDSGVNVAGVQIDRDITSETETFRLMKNFSSKARAHEIQSLFVLGVSTLSLTTSAVAYGFDLLGGSAIRRPVDKPAHIYRYDYDELIRDLASS